MNEYRIAVMRIVARGGGSFGWYQIEQRLGGLDLTAREHLPSVLNELVDAGLLDRAGEDRNPLYLLTKEGEEALREIGE